MDVFVLFSQFLTMIGYIKFITEMMSFLLEEYRIYVPDELLASLVGMLIVILSFLSLKKLSYAIRFAMAISFIVLAYAMLEFTVRYFIKVDVIVKGKVQNEQEDFFKPFYPFYFISLS